MPVELPPDFGLVDGVRDPRDAEIADLRHQLWLLLGDVRARMVSCTCPPPPTQEEIYHAQRAEALLAGYELAE